MRSRSWYGGLLVAAFAAACSDGADGTAAPPDAAGDVPVVPDGGDDAPTLDAPTLDAPAPDASAPDAPAPQDASPDDAAAPPDAPAVDAEPDDAPAPDASADATPSTCGNGFVDRGESCDLAIPAGRTGACATTATCPDTNPCTTDTVLNEGTCRALCTHPIITAAASGDGCCPAGANASNDNDCRAACGNGVLEPGEQCDTTLAAGRPGACPTVATCNDMIACTADAVMGAGTCAAACTHTAITAPASGDGCCPPGATAATDGDCRGVCGNGVLEPGEQCDTTLAAGRPGACPTAATCNDMIACTADAVLSAGTCAAACTHTAITTAASGDGCCPPGATAATDNDCRAVCGNGALEPGEVCDTLIAAGRPGACPTVASCNDMMACTRDTVAGAGTCGATCARAPITAPTNGDGCCPAGATASNDNDCRAVCGNRVVEPGEQCDDGNTTPGDGCGATCLSERTALRMNTLSLVDPHAFASVFGFCADVTATVNTQFTNGVTTDTTAPPDGLLDLSVVSVFSPLNPAAPTSPMLLTFPNCTAPLASTRCTLPAGATSIAATATNRAAGTCLAPVAGTFRASYAPAIAQPAGPCFSAPLGNVTFTIAGIAIPLQSAQIGATYAGAPTSQLVTGVVYGFLTQTAAQAVILPTTLAVVGGRPLASLLAGGPGNCRTGGNSDQDTVGGAAGWWVYLNFTATSVPYS
jgi:cysteine-rich repeat protein